jgi:hypothetical protein
MTKKMAVDGSISYSSMKTAKSQSARFKTHSREQPLNPNVIFNDFYELL